MKRDLVIFTAMTAAILVLSIGCPTIRPNTPSDAAVTDGPLDDDAPPNVRPTIDAANDCAAACERLRALGCREGKLSDCADVVCRMNSDTHFTHYDLACVTAASNPAVVRACGGQCTL